MERLPLIGHGSGALWLQVDDLGREELGEPASHR